MILFTHHHFDHLWGISDHENASLLFPSAEFVASETEVAFWSFPAANCPLRKSRWLPRRI
jgi:glyoxylase-like metal-dependent hydrolase (beta-lactamase superfamily II)